MSRQTLVISGNVGTTGRHPTSREHPRSILQAQPPQVSRECCPPPAVAHPRIDKSAVQDWYARTVRSETHRSWWNLDPSRPGGCALALTYLRHRPDRPLSANQHTLPANPQVTEGVVHNSANDGYSGSLGGLTGSVAASEVIAVQLEKLGRSHKNFLKASESHADLH